ncbi:MAG: hypothetical protein R6V58_04945 [Planctomycetota bacterium]
MLMQEKTVQWQSRKQRGRQGRGEVFTAGLAALALIAIMAPALVRTYQMSVTLRCGQRLSQIYRAVHTYAQSHDGHVPCQAVPPDGRGDWREIARAWFDPPDASESEDIWTCPGGRPYVGNVHLFGPPHRPMSDYLLTLEVGLAADGLAEYDEAAVGDFAGVDWRHRDHANVLFLDGHVEWVAREKPKSVPRWWNRPQ